MGSAPGALAGLLSNKLSGGLACVIVGTFRWWLGIGLFVVWVLNRIPLRRRMVAIARTFAGEAPVLRRANYFQQLASRPTAAKEGRVFGLDGWVVARFREQFTDGWRRVWALQNRMLANTMVIGIEMLAIYGVAYGVVADAGFNGTISLARVATLLPVLGLTYQVGLIDPFDDPLNFAIAALPQLESLEEELRASDTLAAQPSTQPPRAKRAVRFEGVGFTYPGSNTPVFEHLDLSLPAGQSTAIVGANGAGKTTLVKLLTRLHEPTQGAILVDDVELTSVDAASWQRQSRSGVPGLHAVSVVGGRQRGLRFGRAPPRSARDGSRGTTGRRPRHRRGLGRRLGHRAARAFSGGADLSGGQWQRLSGPGLVRGRPRRSVARSGRANLVARRTRRREFFDRFLDITSGLTTLIISHRFSTVRRADHIVVVERGSVVEEGTHDTLVAAGGHYATSFNLQAARFSSDPAPGTAFGERPQ